MFTKDIKSDTTLATLLKSQTITAATNGPGVDVSAYCGNVMAILNAAKGTGNADNTLNVKVQDSADNATFADVNPAKTFTQVLGTGGTDSLEAVSIDTRSVRKYIRLVFTPAGTTPSYVVSAQLVGQPSVV